MEFEDGKQIVAAFNGGLKPAAQGWVSHKQNYVVRFAGSVVFLCCISRSLRCGLEEFRQLRWLNIPNPRDFRRTLCCNDIGTNPASA